MWREKKNVRENERWWKRRTLPHGCLPSSQCPYHMLLFSHTGLREASHRHLEARRLTTSQFIKKKHKKNSMLTENLGSQTASPEPWNTESPKIAWFQQHLDGIITITWLESPICFISTSLRPTTGSCANPSLAAQRRLSRYNPLTVVWHWADPVRRTTGGICLFSISYQVLLEHLAAFCATQPFANSGSDASQKRWVTN